MIGGDYMDARVRVGGVYKHFKGSYYTVLCIACDSETMVPTVIYKNLNSPAIWARPLESFISKVDKKKYPDATQEDRFELMYIEGEIHEEAVKSD